MFLLNCFIRSYLILTLNFFDNLNSLDWMRCSLSFSCTLFHLGHLLFSLNLTLCNLFLLVLSLIRFNCWFCLSIWSNFWLNLLLWWTGYFLWLRFIFNIDSLCFRFLNWLRMRFGSTLDCLLLITRLSRRFVLSLSFRLISYCSWLLICLLLINLSSFLIGLLQSVLLDLFLNDGTRLLNVRAGLNSLVRCRRLFVFISKTHFKFWSQSFQIGNTQVQFIQLVCPFLISISLCHFIIQLISFSFIHGFEALGKCFQKGMHWLGHFLVEISNLAIDILHFNLCFLNFISGFVQIFFVLCCPGLSLI